MRLYYLGQDGQQQSIDLTREPISIGRGEDADILIKDDKTHSYMLSIDGQPDMELLIDNPQVIIEPGGVADLSARLRIDPVDLDSRSTEGEFRLQSSDGNISISESARFVGPTP